MRVKLKDIAEKSGFSITTVSRALAGYDDVNEQTRQQISAIALDMGYQPNLVAQQLRNQRTYTLGMIIPLREKHFSDDFFNELMHGVGYGAAKQHYDLLLSAQTSPEDEMQAYRRLVGGRRVEGVVLARTRRDDPRIQYLQANRFPFVVSGRMPPGYPSPFAYIDVDSQLGIRMAVEHLISLGHQHIGLILPPAELAFTAYRLAGYQEALELAGLPYQDNYVVHSSLERSGGYDAAGQLLQQQARISAIAACNDLMALGVIRYLHEQGIQVGRHFAVTGFDDIPAAAFSNPSLTTVQQPIFEIGQRLIDMLIRMIEGDSLESTQLLLKPQLKVRASSDPGVRAE